MYYHAFEIKLYLHVVACNPFNWTQILFAFPVDIYDVFILCLYRVYRHQWWLCTHLIELLLRLSHKHSICTPAALQCRRLTRSTQLYLLTPFQLSLKEFTPYMTALNNSAQSTKAFRMRMALDPDMSRPHGGAGSAIGYWAVFIIHIVCIAVEVSRPAAPSKL